jgi:hypothetical protein
VEHNFVLFFTPIVRQFTDFFGLIITKIKFLLKRKLFIMRYYHKFLYWTEVAMKAIAVFFKLNMKMDELFTEESLVKILGKNKRHKDAFDGLSGTDTKSCQLYEWMKFTVEKVLNDKDLTAVATHNHRAQSVMGDIMDSKVAMKLIEAASHLDRKLTFQECYVVYTEIQDSCPHVRKSEVNSKTLWRLLGRLDDLTSLTTRDQDLHISRLAHAS